MLAKGLRVGTWLAAVPLASFAGLSGGGVASCGIALKLLEAVSVGFQCMCTVEPHYSGSLPGWSRSRSWRRVSLRCCAVVWPWISLLRMPTAFRAAFCWSVVRVEGGVGGSAEGKGMMSAKYQSAALE
jgi:hypothetical protein